MQNFARNSVSKSFSAVQLRRVGTDFAIAGKEKKRVNKSVAQAKQKTAAEATSNEPSNSDLKAALDKVMAEEVPTDLEEREKYFMSQVGMGEQLALQGTCLLSGPLVFLEIDM
jgi:hypothetical protein